MDVGGGTVGDEVGFPPVGLICRMGSANQTELAVGSTFSGPPCIHGIMPDGVSLPLVV